MAYFTLLRAVACFFLLTVSAFADWPYDSVGDITCVTGQMGENAVFGGSGTLIGVSADGSFGLMASCAHVFDEGMVEVTIRFPNSKPCACKLLHIDYERDMSLWQTSAPPPEIKTAVAVTKVKPEDGPFTAVGFPGYGEGGQHFNVGQFISYDRNGYEVYVAMDVHSGYSGGGLFNKYGEYVGIVCGNTPLINGMPAEIGKWESRHTTGDSFLDMVDDYIPVKK